MTHTRHPGPPRVPSGGGDGTGGDDIQDRHPGLW